MQAIRLFCVTLQPIFGLKNGVLLLFLVQKTVIEERINYVWKVYKT